MKNRIVPHVSQYNCVGSPQDTIRRALGKFPYSNAALERQIKRKELKLKKKCKAYCLAGQSKATTNNKG